ncbi:hypothetical protein EDD15DRAFT_2202621 [Pisolithus albus]|nr:hypothetical protein EDD15DRAFT_2202621 [Pisolithus albus]
MCSQGRQLCAGGVKHLSDIALQEVIWELKEVEHYNQYMHIMHQEDVEEYNSATDGSDDADYMEYTNEVYNEEILLINLKKKLNLVLHPEPMQKVCLRQMMGSCPQQEMRCNREDRLGQDKIMSRAGHTKQGRGRASRGSTGHSAFRGLAFDANHGFNVSGGPIQSQIGVCSEQPQ